MCSGAAAAAAPAPPLAPALWRRARPSALKDSHRAPFKRQRERANHPAAGAPRPRRGPGRAAWPRAAAAAAAAQDLTFHPGPAAATRSGSARLARCRRLRAARGDGARPPGSTEPLAPSARVAARSSPPWAGRGRWPGGGEGTVLSPPAPSSLGKVYFRSASLCLWFHFLFPDHDSNTIEGNHI